MRRQLTLDRAQIFEGSLVLVNPTHPIRREGLVELVPADPGYPRVLLERRTAGLLQACLQSIRARGAIVPVSGWRSRREQQEIWDDTLRQQGEEFTRSYVALPGCSEHQTGLAIDLGAAAEHIDFIRPEFPAEGVCGNFRRVAALALPVRGGAPRPAHGGEPPVPGGVRGLCPGKTPALPDARRQDRHGDLPALPRGGGGAGGAGGLLSALRGQ